MRQGPRPHMCGRAGRRMRRPGQHRSRHASVTLAAFLVCAVALSACGAKQDTISAASTKPFKVMLDWFPNADHAALYSAIAHGDFRAVGLDVEPVVPSEAAEPLKLLAAGKVDMAISYEPEVLLARDQGLKVVSIAALVQRPLTSIIALPEQHVSSVASLAGKTVGTAGIPYQAVELRTTLEHAGVSPAKVREVNVGFNLVAAMLSGKVAATLGGYWNYEAIQLRLLHKHPTVIPINEAGVPTYDELVLVASSTRLRSDPSYASMVRRFVAAFLAGSSQAQAHPAQARSILASVTASSAAFLDRATPATLSLLNSPGGVGCMYPTQWQQFGAWMQARKLVSRSIPASAVMTTRFLPARCLTRR